MYQGIWNPFSQPQSSTLVFYRTFSISKIGLANGKSKAWKMDYFKVSQTGIGGGEGRDAETGKRPGLGNGKGEDAEMGMGDIGKGLI
jgi:hypothetical protein